MVEVLVSRIRTPNAGSLPVVCRTCVTRRSAISPRATQAREPRSRGPRRTGWLLDVVLQASVLLTLAIGGVTLVRAQGIPPATLDDDMESVAEPEPGLPLTRIGVLAMPVTLETPPVTFLGAPITISVTPAVDEEEVGGLPVRVPIEAGGEVTNVVLRVGESTNVSYTPRHPADVSISVDGARYTLDVRVWPGWLTLLPSLIAIGMALITRQVVVSLLSGIFIGALLLSGLQPVTAFSRTLSTYVVGAMFDDDHVTIAFIALILGGMSGVVSRGGGGQAMVRALAARVRTATGGQLGTWFMGLVVFFDDYANTLIVGNTMRALTDKLRVSREKLSFLVDSTAAPVASIAPISTWIGFEVGLIAGALSGIGVERDAYGVFVASIPYRFYPIFALILGLGVILTGRDFGPMLTAERRARRGHGVVREGADPMADTMEGAVPPHVLEHAHASNALAPIVVVILVTLLGIAMTGWNALPEGGRTISAAFGEGDSYTALLWAGAWGSIVAIVLGVGRRALSLAQAMSAWVDGVRAMTTAMVILVLAWGIGAVCGAMGTADVLVGALGDRFPAALLPAAVFLMSALVSFATGTSWGTMAILVPIVVPLGYQVGNGSEHILLGAVSGVLAGSVFGDHCSPISDTTVLSSLATGADHMDHVRTQLPYALTAAAIAILVGDLPSAVGLPAWMSIGIGVAAVIAVVRLVGRPVDARPET